MCCFSFLVSGCGFIGASVEEDGFLASGTQTLTESLSSKTLIASGSFVLESLFVPPTKIGLSQIPRAEIVARESANALSSRGSITLSASIPRTFAPIFTYLPSPLKVDSEGFETGKMCSLGVEAKAGKFSGSGSVELTMKLADDFSKQLSKTSVVEESSDSRFFQSGSLSYGPLKFAR